MYPNAQLPAGNSFYSRLPKVELHRHLEGSLRLETMQDIARQHDIAVPTNDADLSALVQVQRSEPLTFQNFLGKFSTLRLFYRSPEAIERITREAIEDAANDGILYLELRFTPVALSRAERFPLHDVMDWVCESAARAARDFGITVQLIASVNRHESPQLAEQVAWLAADYQDKGIVGLDLAGNEAEFPAQPFASIFREARESGLQITVHAGEWGGAENVREAIESLGAARIGHGIRTLEDPSVCALARERGTVFEVCITSNYQTGIVPSLPAHPFPKMLAENLNVTINTDDPGISAINLSHEYQVAVESLGLSQNVLRALIFNAAEAAFLPVEKRATLRQRLEDYMQRYRLF